MTTNIGHEQRRPAHSAGAGAARGAVAGGVSANLASIAVFYIVPLFPPDIATPVEMLVTTAVGATAVAALGYLGVKLRDSGLSGLKAPV